MVDPATRVLATQSDRPGAYQVLADAQTVQFPCGQSVRLHPVRCSGVPVLRLRALHRPNQPGPVLQLLCLDRMARGLDAELRAAPERDRAGLVLYTLRQAWPTAQAFVAAAARLQIGAWWRGTGDALVYQPPLARADANMAGAGLAAALGARGALELPC
jgi:hypothetical protein